MQYNHQNGTARSPALQIGLLGTPQILLNGAPLEEAISAKAQALLFYLAMTRRRHTRPALAALLWGDVPDATARGNLRKALQQLREHLGAFLVIQRDTVALPESAACWLDAAEFQTALGEMPDIETPDRLERAIRLYRGDFLAGFYVRNAPDFENWWLSERTRMRELMLNALNRLADHYAGQGDLDRAVALIRRSLEIERWREEAHRRLMTWLALSGQRSAALAQYEVCRRMLAEDLDVEPATETSTLYARIRTGDLESLSAAEIPPLELEPRAPTFLDSDADIAGSPRAPFVGRERQVARLAGFLEAAIAGQGQAAFVIGEAGWGKTRLLAEFSRYAQEVYPELLVAYGVCTTFTEAGDPYLPFRGILRMLCADVEQGWAAGRVTRFQALRLWRFLPRIVEALLAEGRHLIGTLVPGEELLLRAAAHEAVGPGLLKRLNEAMATKRGGHGACGMDQARIFEQVANLLQTVSRERPLLLIVDDLHWADLSSLRLLFHLSRRLADSHILILCAYRPEDVSPGPDGQAHPLVSILAEFKRRFGDVWVYLGHDWGEERAFVDALLDSEPNRLGGDFRAELARTTKGHPLFTFEMLRDMQEHGSVRQDESGRWVQSASITWDTLPSRVEGVIERRINRLDPAQRSVLVTASVEGEEFTAEVLAQARKVGEAEMVGVLSGDLARNHRLVQASGVERLGEKRIAHYRFSHNLFQKYLYDSLDPVERAYLHEAVGNALEKVYAGRTDEIAVHLARHFREAGRLVQAIKYLERAGDSSARVYANSEAIAHYSEAIDLASQIDIDAEALTLLYTRLGRTLELESQFDRVLTTYEAMETVAHQRADRHMELASLMARTTIQSVPTAVYQPDQARLLGQRALALARELGDRAAESEILWSLSLGNHYTNRSAEAIECGERSLALARELGLREQTAQTLNDLGGLIYLYSGRLDQAREALQEAGELWHAVGNTPMLADSLSGLCVAHVYAGEYERAIALSEQAFQTSRAIENLWGQSYSRWAVGDAFRARGEYSRAIAASEESVRLGALAGFLVSQTYPSILLGRAYGDLGALDEGLEWTRFSLNAAEVHRFRLHVASALGVLASLYVLKGDLAGAEVAIEEGKREAFRGSGATFYLPVLWAEAELAFCRRDYDGGLAAANDLLARLRQYGMRLGLSEALYWQGQALRGLGQEEAARSRLLEAWTEAEEIGSRRTLWRILAALGQMQDDPKEALSLRNRAQENLRVIAGHIHQPALRASFLDLPDVRAVLESTQPEWLAGFRRET